MVLKYLEKLGEITSIQVAKQHLEFLAAQLEAKQKECDGLNRTLATLQSENDRLNGENSRLKQNLEDAALASTGTPEPTEAQQNILKLMFERGESEWRVEQVSSQLGVNVSMAQFHLDALFEADLIDLTNIAMGGGMIYRLTSAGRAYVVQNNLAC